MGAASKNRPKHRGVVFACSDQRWLGETVVSAQSFERHMPQLTRELFIPEALHRAAGGGLEQFFDRLVVLKTSEHPRRPRFDSCLRTRLEQAIFIDGDTLLLEPVPELFDLLDNFDIAVSPAPQYLSPQAVSMGIFDQLPAVPAALPEWNTGLIVANIDMPFRSMVRTWSELFAKCQASGFTMDQAAFRSALVHSRLRIAPLPANYNFRANVPQGITGVVKILHAHGELATIAGYINGARGIRTYTPRREHIHGFRPKPG
jgi:hypothetical protein